ncbi:MAG: RNase J family beta-CASP ribonuclease [Clostridiales bacterium]|nr:RNase J family beta-CASP ribonuclease [Clostridiales bacterium]
MANEKEIQDNKQEKTAGTASKKTATNRKRTPAQGKSTKSQQSQTTASKQEKSAKKPQSTQAKKEKTAEKPKKTAGNSGKSSAKMPKTTAKATAAAKTTMTENSGNVTDMRRPPARRAVKKTPVRIIPLGGLSEIGKNMTLYECGQDMFIVDCGLSFPDPDMLGVDLVIPDFTFVEQNVSKIRGIVLTHGHEDHIGGLAYLLKKINCPVYGTKLTLGLVEGKLKEHNLLGKISLNVVAPRQTIKLGCMAVEFIRVNHSIPDAVALAIHTPAGIIIQTGDFKIDYTPIESEVIDLGRFAELGNRGVLCLLSDSTNAERPGSSMSESKVGNSFDALFKTAGNRRIIIATFASNIHRVQQIVDNAVRYNRKIAVSGRSMVNVVTKALELGYLNIPEGVLIDIDAIGRYPSEQIIVITTGSQGEPMAALSRMASGDHRMVSVTSEDFIIISANPIPGNEKHVNRVVNELMKFGAEVIYETMYEVHVSGHACQDELRLMLTLTKPKFFMPVHGEFKHLKKHAGIAKTVGIPESNIYIGEIGDVIELDGVSMKKVGTVTAGKVLVDGYGVGDVGSIVLKDRKHLAEDGLIIVVATIERESGVVMAGPDIVSRGFVYVRESEELMTEAKNVVKAAFRDCEYRGVTDWNNMKMSVKDELSGFIYRKTKRSPMILPIIMEI